MRSLLLFLCISVVSVRADDFFETNVRPVLVEHCYKCHNAKLKEPKGNLRVDSRAGLLQGGDNGPSLVPGEPDKSKFIEAIRYTNTDMQMPPKGKLSAKAIADLEKWVKDGATWPGDTGTASANTGIDVAKRKQEHWAWAPIRTPKAPAVKDGTWAKNDYDRFILAALEAKNLKPARETDARTLIRRVHFDLVGLPPTPAEVADFVVASQKDANAALESLVTKLLASDAFGERWARHWLDLVRYGETRGHEFDPTIPNAFQYRDYVIRALNADVPYNQFVHEHVAGDLLPNPRKHPKEGYNEALLGTGFWFLGEEVHSPVDIRQDQADRFDNRIDVLTKTFMALTVSCARCHDHKFDAITTKDYYALFGLLESSSYRLARFDTREQHAAIAKKLATAEQQATQMLLKQLRPQANLAALLLASRQAILKPEFTGTPTPETFSATFRERIADIAEKEKLDAKELTQWVAILLQAQRDPNSAFHVFAKLLADPKTDDAKHFANVFAPMKPKLFTLPKNAEVVLDFTTNDAFRPDDATFGTGPARAGSLRMVNNQPQFVETTAAQYDRFWDKLTYHAQSEDDNRSAINRKGRAGRMFRTPTFKLNSGHVYYLVRGSGTAYAAVAAHTLIAGPLHGRLVMDFPEVPGYRWVHHDLTPYKGQYAHVELATNGNTDFAIAMVVQAEQQAPPALPTPQLGTDATTLSELATAFQNAYAELVSGKITTAAHARLANTALQQNLFDGKDTLATLTATRQQLATEVRPDSRLALAMLDGNSVTENVFIRGSPKGMGEAVPRRFLEALTRTKALPGPGSGRYEFAQMLTDPSVNPFISRVMVNRVWHHLFGKGIVASVDNFGVLGETPSHPELLDALAVQFVRDGWSLKKLVRSLVLSSAYRMSSTATDADADDPQNRLLHRMNLRRMDGEAIRDAMLVSSGRLDRTMYGPSIPIYLTPFLDGRGKPNSGPMDGNGRRSVYIATKRNFLSPFLQAFDTPIPFSTVGRRQISNVPAQALILLNDPFVHQQAALWAKKLQATADHAQRLTLMYETAFCRAPSADELAACQEFIAEQTKRYQAKADDMRPWTDLAHMLFNAKEFIYVN